MPSPVGAVICRSFPVSTKVLTVELSNFPRSQQPVPGVQIFSARAPLYETYNRLLSQINDGGFRICVRSFRLCNAGKNQEGEHKAVLCKLGESKCKCVLFSRECWSRFRGRFDEKSGAIMQPVREED